MTIIFGNIISTNDEFSFDYLTEEVDRSEYTI